MFEIRYPRAPLSSLIECYWFSDVGASSSRALDELIIPDARADIVFTFHSPYIRARGDRPGIAQRIATAHVDAQRRYPVRIHRQEGAGLIWVRFRLGGLAAFVRGPVHELSGHAVSLVDLFGPPALKLEEQLWHLAGRPGLQVELLDAFFLSRIALPSGYHQVMRMIQIIERRRGVISVSELSHAGGYSVRTVDRLFQRVIGLPPKFFARTVRIRHVHQSVVASPKVHWGDIVAMYGYVDESHMARDVLSLTGMGPQAYREFLRQKETACLRALSRFYMGRDELWKLWAPALDTTSGLG